MTYVLDTNALITFLENRPGAETVERIFFERTTGRAEIVMCAVNWGEAYYVLRRKMTSEAVLHWLAPFTVSIQIAEVNRRRAENAAEIKKVFKLGYADAFAAELAIATRGTLVSSDPVFKKLGRELSLRLLPSPRRAR